MIDAPYCPPYYFCTFTPQQKYIVRIHAGLPWYQGPAGIVLAACTLVALTVAVITVAVLVCNLRRKVDEKRQNHLEQREIRQHKLALEEQKTMQAEQAKGNPEMLKLIRGI